VPPDRLAEHAGAAVWRSVQDQTGYSQAVVQNIIL
jgi:hypothetical protein